MGILDTFIDLIIGKVQTMITTEMQASVEPVCFDLMNQIKVVKNELFCRLAPVHTRMKRYCFKHSVEGKTPESTKSGKVSTSDNAPTTACARLLENNLMQSAKLVRDGVSSGNAVESNSVHKAHVTSNLMHCEKLGWDEISSVFLAEHPWVAEQPGSTFSHNLMQTDQFDTGETLLQECIEFDELMNDFHSTAASAKVLRQSLDNTSETLQDCIVFDEPTNPAGFNSSPCSAAFNNAP